MVTIIRDKILDYMGLDSAPMVIVGNKSDLDSQRCVVASGAVWSLLMLEGADKWKGRKARS